MAKRMWKKIRPTSLNHAMELCLDHAREERRLKADGVSSLMGLASHWTLYKWVENGRMPAVLVRAFEHACGIDYVTQYLAYSCHKLVVDIPTGRNITEMEVNELQGSFTEALGLVIRFYNGVGALDETIAALNNVMAGLAWHRENVGKHARPELGLFDGGEE